MNEFYYDDCGGYCAECVFKKNCPHKIVVNGEIKC